MTLTFSLTCFCLLVLGSQGYVTTSGSCDNKPWVMWIVLNYNPSHLTKFNCLNLINNLDLNNFPFYKWLVIIKQMLVINHPCYIYNGQNRISSLSFLTSLVPHMVSKGNGDLHLQATIMSQVCPWTQVYLLLNQSYLCWILNNFEFHY